MIVGLWSLVQCSVEYYGSDCSSDEDKPKPHPLPQKDLSDVKPSMAGTSCLHLPTDHGRDRPFSSLLL